MVHIDLQDPRLFQAMTLRERLQAPGSPGPERNGGDPELAAFRLGRWQGQAPFSSDALLDRRLAVDGLDRGRFLHLLGEECEAVKDRWLEPPAWLAVLTTAFESENTGRGAVEELSKSVPPDPRLGFLNAVEPILAGAREKLQAKAGEIASGTLERPFDPGQVVPLFFPALVRQLVGMLSPALVLEMHVAGVNGLLTGASPPERFASFIERLRTREAALEILTEYSCLARQLVLRVEQWVESSSEFLAHLAADWEEIRRCFGPGLDSARLIGIDGGSGDRHRGGRSVLIASFSGGRRLVYKPRSLAIDVHFQRLLKWLNERGTGPDFPILNLLDRSSHGWVEYVAAQDCGSPAEVADFYQRQGSYLALLYALQATDFHYENVIAAGPCPILVDLEALFHPRVGHELLNAEHAATRAMFSSVLRVGLLPQRMFAHGNSEGVDVSGLGAREGQLSPQAVPVWEAAGTNEMRLVRKRMPMHGGRNRPSLDGRSVDSLEHVPALLAGFERMYGLLLEHREALLAPDGPLSWFAGDPVRVIIRPTRVYALLLQEGFNPDLLRDALDRDRHFDRLWLDIEACPYLEDLIPYEQAALASGDIPLFTTSANSRDLCLDDERRVPDLFEASGLELARERLRGLSEEDLRRQVWLVRATMATLGGEAGQQPAPAAPQAHRPAGLDRDGLIAAARSVGDRVERLAIRDRDEVGWPGLAKVGADRFAVVALGTDLYDGLPGVALFLAYLGRITGESRFTDLARTALFTLRRHLDRQRQRMTRIGGFSGWGGIVYALAHLGVLWKEEALLDEAQGLLPSLRELVDGDEDLDLIDGAAGCIGSLITLHRCSPSDLAFSVAVQCGDHLLARGREQSRGIAWLTRIESKAPLTGFAHGAAGIAWALLELATLTGEERFATAAREAAAYERSLFNPKWESWPDLRNRHGEEETFTTAWCFGAPGIGLARLSALDRWPDEANAAEVHAAVRTTLRHGFGFNHSLCHGDLGNLELLVQAAQRGLEPGLEAEWKRVAGEILGEVAQGRPRCATPLAIESPGLMTGLSGIGYGLLRLAAPELVPSVLLLEPPRL